MTAGDRALLWLLTAAVIAFVSFSLSWWVQKDCANTCRAQYGDEYSGVQGTYETCRCIDPDGYPRYPQ